MLSVIHFIVLNETETSAPFSGAENHLFVLLRALREAGLTVELGILLQHGGPAIEAKIAELQSQGIAVSCFPFRYIIDPLCVAVVRRHLLSRRDWIIHTHLDDADVVGKTAAWLAGCRRVVSTVHNNELKHDGPKWFYLLRLMDRLTKHHIAITHVVNRHLVEVERVAPEKVTVIPYGVLPPPAEDDRLTLRARLGLPEEAFIVGYVGRLIPQKNLPLLIKAMARTPDMLCAIVGGGELQEQLERQAAGLSNVRFLGYHPQAASLMPAFDALCLPSRWEGLGLVLVEAMLRRVPIVGSRAGAIPEVLGEGQYGVLFGPDDVDGLVRALKTVRASGAELADRAYHYARATFTVEKMVARTLAVYEQLTLE